MYLMDNFFRKTFYKNWDRSSPNTFRNLEIVINGKCEMNCKYCYINKYRSQYFPDGTEREDEIVNNLYILKALLEKEKVDNLSVTLFGGEIFSQKIGKYVFKTVSKDFGMVRRIHVPTNMNFIFNDEKEITDLVDLCLSTGKELSINASLDGILMEENRPFKENLSRDNNFYDKVFKFCSKYGFGFHPMIYSENIEKWIDNFKWFESQFKKYNMDMINLNLLEIRNENWNEKQCIEFSKFIKFLIFWTYEHFGKEKIIDQLIFPSKRSILNMLSTPFLDNRGISCSIQTLLALRIGDLKVFPCHRLMYNEFATCKLNKETLKFEDLNSSLGISIYTHNGKNIECGQCMIRELCQRGCLGAQREVMNDPFISIPTVCRLEHHKVLTILKSYNEIGILPELISKLSSKKLEQINYLKREGYI